MSRKSEGDAPRIALISPTLPPDVCGVGDHSAQLARALGALEVPVGLWTARPAADLPGTVHVPGPWGFSSLGRIARELSRWQPAAVLLQYTPQLYAFGGRGPNPALLAWIPRLRRCLPARTPIALIAHELHYPVGLDPRGLLLGLPQALRFHVLAAQADHVCFTYKAALRSTARRLPWRRRCFHVLPVGSNIDFVERAEVRGRLRQELGLAEDTVVLLHFGGTHPTHLIGHMVEALRRAKELYMARRLSGALPVLVFVGATPEQVCAKLREHRSLALKGQVKGLGYLPAAQVSAWLRASDLVLAPFMDGVSTRRGSFLAALAHGTPVVTTQGWATDPALPWEKFCGLAPVEDLGAFAAQVEEGLLRPELARERALRGLAFHQERFSWEAIARGLLNIISVT